MSQTILFDLDDTLLTVNMDRFLPEYFNVLGSTLGHLGTKKEIIQQIITAVDKMAANQDPTKTLKEVFDDNFYRYLGTIEKDCKQILNAFYGDVFPKLKPITNQRSEALEFVDWSLSKGIRITIATNPLFPQSATRQRIEWAGLDPKSFDFFTTYENFHFTKPNLAYYAEILGHLGWPEGSVVMIGDSIELDLIPMRDMGFQTFWIKNDQQINNWEGGELRDLKPWIQKAFTNGNYKLKEHPSIQIAILRSTAAIFDTWQRKLPILLESMSKFEQIKFNQLVAALTNLEINLMSPLWEALIEKAQIEILPLNYEKIPVASSVGYFDIYNTIHSFIETRLSSLNMIDNLDKSGYFTKTVSNQQEKEVFPTQWLTYAASNDRKILKKLTPLLDNYKIF